MAALTCDICGGKLVMGSGGIATCDSCGVEYSLERMREKIQEIRGSVKVEGTVEVQGTVKMDNTDYVKKYLENARRAKQKEDWEETEKYYNLVEQNDPTNIEAIFYSSYGKARASLVESDIYKRQAAFKVLQNCISMIDDKFDFINEAEDIAAIQQISEDLFALSSSNFVYNQTKNGYGVVTRTDLDQTIMLFSALHVEFCIALDHIVSKYPEERIFDSIPICQLYTKHKSYLSNGGIMSPATTSVWSQVRGRQYYISSIIKRYDEKRADEALANALAELEAQQQRNATYWQEHASEKIALENEKNALLAQIDALEQQRTDFPEKTQYEECKDRLAALTAKLSTLGVFKNKEKKEIQEEIDRLKPKLHELDQQMYQTRVRTQKEITPLKDRLREIEKELTKNR